MSQDLATATTASAPQPQTRSGADLLAFYVSKISTIDGIAWSISEEDRPDGRSLVLLQQRRDELSAFQGADPRSIGARVARLFLRYPQMAKATTEQVTAYVQDLRRFPLWAIDKGFVEILAGRGVKSTTFAPTSLELQRAVDKAMAPYRDEFVALGRVLNAVPYRPVALTGDQRRAIVEEVWRKRGLGPDLSASEDAA